MQRLDEGVVIGDGGFVFALEKRGYVKAGPWTPEAVMENTDAGKLWTNIQAIDTNNIKFKESICASTVRPHNISKLIILN